VVAAGGLPIEVGEVLEKIEPAAVRSFGLTTEARQREFLVNGQ